jgi:hypothetical protein
MRQTHQTSVVLLLAFSGITALAQKATMPEPTIANEQPVRGITAGPLFMMNIPPYRRMEKSLSFRASS